MFVLRNADLSLRDVNLTKLLSFWHLLEIVLIFGALGHILGTKKFMVRPPHAAAGNFWPSWASASV